MCCETIQQMHGALLCIARTDWHVVKRLRIVSLAFSCTYVN